MGKWIFCLICIVTLSACSKEELSIQSGNLQIKVNNNLHTLISSQKKDAKPILKNFQPSEFLELSDEKLTDFELSSSVEKRIINEIGVGTQFELAGNNKGMGIEKQITFTIYDQFPDFITTKVYYINKSGKDLLVKSWANNAYQILSQNDEPHFWAFQGSSSMARADWIKPLAPGYYQENFMGMNNSDYGGGIPVTDIWRRDIGIAVGHTELTPKLVSLPTEIKKHSTDLCIGIQKKFDYPNYLNAGDTLQTIETFVSIHAGDYYNGLQKYAQFMQEKGIQMPPAEPGAFEPIWCAWGYERDFTFNEVIGTLPKVKELGIKWVVLDDGFQKAEGDWNTNRNKFPQGDQEMKEFVKTVHNNGLKAKLWWAPLAADPGSDLLAQNPTMRLYLNDWAPQYITWWDAYYLSPSHPKTIEHTKNVVNLFMKDWGFDGLKMDGQHMNAIAPDHNPEAGIAPAESVEKFPEFYELIYNEARKINPGAVIENCPCGTCMSFFNMPYMNQAVSSDPLSSWQIRLKGKTYKALIPKTAYYGDHVELSDGGDDFASSFGIGAVLGTKFTWPKDSPTASASYLLTSEKEEKWKKWFSLYNQKMLSRGTYLGNLYDIGYDQPETHVIQKNDTLHYAFYEKNWDGNIELKGLKQGGAFEVRDYFNDEVIGQVSSGKCEIHLSFEGFLLIDVYQIQP